MMNHMPRKCVAVWFLDKKASKHKSSLAGIYVRFSTRENEKRLSMRKSPL